MTSFANLRACLGRICQIIEFQYLLALTSSDRVVGNLTVDRDGFDHGEDFLTKTEFQAVCRPSGDAGMQDRLAICRVVRA